MIVSNVVKFYLAALAIPAHSWKNNSPYNRYYTDMIHNIWSEYVDYAYLFILLVSWKDTVY